MKSYFLLALAGVAVMPCYADQFIFASSDHSVVNLVTNAGTFSTASHEFTDGTLNQGWWSAADANADTNDNYFAGSILGFLLNDFFTFYIPLDRVAITSATLSIPQLPFSTTGSPFTYSLFDVSTDAATLNNNDGTSGTIFDDLGSGASYGSAFIADDSGTPNPLEITLDPTAVALINATRNGYFSVGGTIFAPSSVPEPGSFVLFGSVLAAVAGKRLFKRTPLN